MPNSDVFPPRLVAALAGSYELLQEVGRGGMGIVYAARDLRLDRLVAIKVLPELVGGAAIHERFLREARAAARLTHPSIVPIYAADERDGVSFLVMAYVDGAPLSAVIRERGRMGADVAVPILRDVALALGAAHARSVVHRDVKPENILMERATGKAFVTDFGIARLADAIQSGALTRTGQVLGTVGYMSPEQVTAAPLDGRSDLYSLGVVAFEMLAGRLPFDGPAPAVIVAHVMTAPPSLETLAPDLPAPLRAIVERCLRKTADERYATGEELAAALEQCLTASPPRSLSTAADDFEERILAEGEATRIWARAAELQAGIDSPAAARLTAGFKKFTGAVPSLTSGYRVGNVRQAAIEAGISAPYVSLALDELRAHRTVPPAASFANALPRRDEERSVERNPTGVRALTVHRSLLAGAPMSIVFEAEVAGLLNPNDFDLITETIRAVIGEAGMASVLGRTLSWSPIGGDNQRRLHVSITAAGGRTVIRAEERLGKLAGGVFGGIVGGAGGGFGGSSFGVTLGAMHAGPFVALGVALGMVAGAYAVARTVFTSMARSRSEELQDLVSRLERQVTALIAEEGGLR